MTPAERSSPYEYRLSYDRNLLGGEELARVEYRRDGVGRWRRFAVVLDDETTYEAVAQNVESLIPLYEASAKGEVAT